MKILFTGATGVLGRASLPILVESGHDVTAVVRSESEQNWLEDVGARSTRVDLFDARAVRDAMAGIDTIVHFATSIPPQSEMRKRSSWAVNDRLRSEATANLVDAGLAQGVHRFVQQSVAFVYADGGDRWLDESSPVAPPWDVLDSALTAEAHVERFRAAGGTGVTLRLGRLYGPGGASDEYIAAVHKRGIPSIGRGANYVSSIHVDDAATALAAALRAPDGVYNVVDDVPMTSSANLAELVRALDAPAPRRIPVWMARLALGDAASLLTVSHRISNGAFRAAAGWAPLHASAAEGWIDVVRAAGAA